MVRILRGPARGKRWISGSTTRGFWLGYWELDIQRWFAANLRGGDVVWDIGAHAGLFTLIASDRVDTKGHVYAFEPFPDNVRKLRKHIQLNHVTNCTVVEAAVCDSSGSKRFDPTVHNSAGHLSDSGGISVRTLSLDDFLFSQTGVRPPSVIKIDAEGAEVEVLAGARETMARFSPKILLSTHGEDVDRRSIEFLQHAGYSCTRLTVDDIWAEKHQC